MTAIDRQLRDPATDGKTIGLLLCKSKNEVVAEYALEDNSKPLGIAEYRLVESLPSRSRPQCPRSSRSNASSAQPTEGLLAPSLAARPALHNVLPLSTVRGGVAGSPRE
jgi:hypothetical protein